MAAIELMIFHKETPRPDGLCPICWNPSLKTYTITRLDLDGLTPVGERNMCPQDKKWIGPKRYYKETTK